jgi:predicted nucleotidyltransferase
MELYARPLLDAVALFEELGIGYALIGGLAAMFYGRSRFTEDVDFAAAAGHMELLAAHPDAMKRYRFDPTCHYMLYHDTGIRIDLWKDEHVAEVISRARVVPMNGTSNGVRVADPHDLIAMKLRAGRIKDDYDVSEILTWSEIDDERIKSMVTGEQWTHLMEIRRRMR